MAHSCYKKPEAKPDKKSGISTLELIHLCVCCESLRRLGQPSFWREKEEREQGSGRVRRLYRRYDKNPNKGNGADFDNTFIGLPAALTIVDQSESVALSTRGRLSLTIDGMATKFVVQQTYVISSRREVCQ